MAKLTEAMKGENNQELLALMAKLTSTVQLHTDLSTRAEHPEWFEDVPSKFKTKEDFMKYRAKMRIRGYLNAASDFVKKEAKGRTANLFKLVIDEFKEALQNDNFFEDYFDRKSRSKNCLCDQAGWFTCELRPAADG